MSPSIQLCPATGMRLLLVKGGTFQMGDWHGDGFDNERPVHDVTLDDFWLGQYPVTQAAWSRVMGHNPSFFQKGDNYPVEQVSWQEVQTFLQRLNAMTEGGYRLPTEAEWEYASRSGGRLERWAGTDDENQVEAYGWFDENAGGTTHPVGQKLPNGLGLYDMSGHVFEMVADVFAEEAYAHHAGHNPCYTGPGVDRVLRGGAWYTYRLLLRCTDRSIYGADYRDRYVGLRVARQAIVQ